MQPEVFPSDIITSVGSYSAESSASANRGGASSSMNEAIIMHVNSLFNMFLSWYIAFYSSSCNFGLQFFKPLTYFVIIISDTAYLLNSCAGAHGESFAGAFSQRNAFTLYEFSPDSGTFKVTNISRYPLPSTG